MKIGITIIHYNDFDNLYNLVKDLKNSKGFSQFFDIVVIDNNTLNKDQILKLNVKVIKNKYNRGFSFAANQGALFFKNKDYLLFLNPDIKILRSSELEKLKNIIKTKNPKLFSINFKNKNYNKPIYDFKSILNEFSPLKFNIKQYKKTIPGAFLGIKTDLFFKIKGFDERYFLWLEDTDLSKRLKNHKCFIYKTKYIVHKGGTSFKKINSNIKKEIFFQSLFLYINKFEPNLSKFILKTIVINRFKKQIGYPILNNGLNMVVPFVFKKNILNFLSKNSEYINKLDELTIVGQIDTKTYWYIKEKFKNVRIINIKKNKGFASTVNYGFNSNTFKYVGTINDDAYPMHTPKELINRLKNKNFGSINPIIKNYDTKNIESAGIKILKKGKAVPIKNFVKNIFITDATNAAHVIYNAKALKHVGFFDEKFNSYLEDIDLSLRLNKKGFKNFVNPNCTTLHEKHKTSKKILKTKQFLDFKNWILVILKNWSLYEKIVYFPSIFIERLKNLNGVIKSFPKYLKNNQ